MTVTVCPLISRCTVKMFIGSLLNNVIMVLIGLPSRRGMYVIVDEFIALKYCKGMVIQQFYKNNLTL